MQRSPGELIISYIALLLAISVHECSHAWTANRLGDPTAKNMGRITLNPIAHIDLIGTVLIPLFIIISGSNFLFGWAKPVPVNPYNLRNQKKGTLWVSFSGPLSNMTLAVMATVFYHMFSFIPGAYFFTQEGISILEPLMLIIMITIQLNIILAVFNLIPIFPLDGSGILMGILPAEKAILFERTKPYGFIILLFLFYTGILGKIMSPLYFIIIKLLMIPMF